jgi:ATP-dependent DNA ligase
LPGRQATSAPAQTRYNDKLWGIYRAFPASRHRKAAGRNWAVSSNAPLPESVALMQLTLVKEPFDSSDWIFEPKLDGYRAIAVIAATGNPRISVAESLTT